jgi:hypothetical protein
MAKPTHFFRSWLLLGCLSGALPAQVVRDVASPDPQQLQIAAWPGPWNLAKPAEVLPLPASAPREWQDMALAFELTLERSPAGAEARELIRLQDAAAPPLLTLALNPEGGLRVGLPDQPEWLASTPLPLGRPITVVLNLRRDPRQALSGLWIDGLEQASANLKPGKWSLGALTLGAQSTPLRLANLRLHASALSRPQILQLGLGLPPPARAPFAGRLDLQPGEVLAVLGGNEAVAVVEQGGLEAGLVRAFALQQPRLRSLAWEADTVFRQDRPLNFGDLSLQLRRCGATAVLLMFGRQECLEGGAAGVAEFEAAHDRLLTGIKDVTPRLLLAEAVPFEAKPKPLPDQSARNADLALYNAALRRLAAKHGALFLGLGTDWQPAAPLTRDGVNLTESGAGEFAERLLIKAGVREAAGLESLRAAVREKNRLWHHYWRPDNWAFLHGDRTAQPSSRDHLNPQLRWFPAELERYQKLIADKENELWKLAEERKVP